jgi:hypothetical protein
MAAGVLVDAVDGLEVGVGFGLGLGLPHDDVKKCRATLTAKGQRSTVVVTRHGSSPTKR